MPSTSNNCAAGGVWIRACPSNTRASWGIFAWRLRPLLREIAAGSRHLFRAPAQLAQARLRGISHFNNHRYSSWDVVGRKLHVVGQRRQGDRPAGAVSRLLRRPGLHHRLRGAVALAACPGQRTERFIWSNPSTWMPLVSGLAVPRPCPRLPGLYSSEFMLRITRLECSMSGSDYIKLVRLKGMRRAGGRRQACPEEFYDSQYSWRG